MNAQIRSPKPEYAVQMQDTRTPSYIGGMSKVRRISLAINAVGSYGRGIIRGVMAYSRANPRWIISPWSPSLSSIALPAEQIGHEAAAQLDRLMDGEAVPYGPTLVAPLRVVPRESTNTLAIPDPDVAAAIRFIREGAAKPLQVDDVLKHVPISRRSLQRRFRDFAGRSITDEIRKAHVDVAKQLLTATDLSIPQIASASGFTSATRLGIIFQHEVSEAPTDYRRRSRIGGSTLRK